jgi:hypothetical protein
VIEINILGFCLVIILILMGSGCITQKETLSVQPIIDYYPLNGYAGHREEALYVLAGDIDDVKKNLKDIIVNLSTPRYTFNRNETINLIVFRGVFNTGGHSIKIDRIEKIDTTIIVYATYIDAGKGMMVTQAFTQPTAIIPIGTLSEGEFTVKLNVSTIVKTEEKDTVEEENVEHKSVTFHIN